MRNYLFFLSIVVLLPFASLGCGKSKKITEPEGEKPPLQDYYYIGDISPLVAQYCLDCHSVYSENRHGAPSIKNFDTYEDVYNYSGAMNLRIQEGTMPPSGPLSDKNKEMFQEWINQGRKNQRPATSE